MLLRDSFFVEHFKANTEGAEINFHKLRRMGVGGMGRVKKSRSEIFEVTLKQPSRMNYSQKKCQAWSKQTGMERQQTKNLKHRLQNAFDGMSSRVLKSLCDEKKLTVLLARYLILNFCLCSRKHTSSSLELKALCCSHVVMPKRLWQRNGSRFAAVARWDWLSNISVYLPCYFFIKQHRCRLPRKTDNKSTWLYCILHITLL